MCLEVGFTNGLSCNDDNWGWFLWGANEMGLVVFFSEMYLWKLLPKTDISVIRIKARNFKFLKPSYEITYFFSPGWKRNLNLSGVFKGRLGLILQRTI